ncbi:MAG: glycosyltransferase family 2 protein [Pseudomonadota bacterium]
MLEKTHYTISINIRTFNEEAKIASAIKSSLKEIEGLVGGTGEVIIVDSLSTDNTVNIAQQFPVRIVQFTHREDCNCGAAVQLGYQHAKGDFIYVLDGDMEFVPGFINIALEKLLNNPTLAGVGGIIKDTQILTMGDRIRANQLYNFSNDYFVNELGGGGLYRRSAIESVGYLGHQGLRAFEEADLGFRLTAQGWKMLRLACPAVLHTGHNESTFEMFRRLWQNKKAFDCGTLVKIAFGKPWFTLTLKKQWYVFVLPALLIISLIASGILYKLNENVFSFFSSMFLIYFGLWGIIFLLMSYRKHSLKLGLFSIVSWHYSSIAATIGILQNLADPYRLIQSQEILFTQEK